MHATASFPTVSPCAASGPFAPRAPSPPRARRKAVAPKRPDPNASPNVVTRTAARKAFFRRPRDCRFSGLSSNLSYTLGLSMLGTTSRSKDSAHAAPPTCCAAKRTSKPHTWSSIRSISTQRPRYSIDAVANALKVATAWSLSFSARSKISSAGSSSFKFAVMLALPPAAKCTSSMLDVPTSFKSAPSRTNTVPAAGSSACRTVTGYGLGFRQSFWDLPVVPAVIVSKFVSIPPILLHSDSHWMGR
mmetsp:Transcript_103829/g.318000  ORF Transcript_103829/g.318000 Transcript_103829/m.318000 type:complete len:246 (-) Transcript_103829:191-928(-)